MINDNLNHKPRKAAIYKALPVGQNYPKTMTIS